jgi:hypothetical protein
MRWIKALVAESPEGVTCFFPPWENRGRDPVIRKAIVNISIRCFMV